MKISDTLPPFVYFFKTTPPILPTAPYLWGKKSEPPPPLVPPYKGRRGFQLCLTFLS